MKNESYVAGPGHCNYFLSATGNAQGVLLVYRYIEILEFGGLYVVVQVKNPIPAGAGSWIDPVPMATITFNARAVHFFFFNNSVLVSGL